MAETTELVEVDELGRPECLRLLAGGVVGRVVFSDAAMPAARPVAYVIDGGEVVFRTADRSPFAVATRDTVVAFEADEIDPVDLTGWTVLGIGTSYPVTEPDRLSRLAGPASSLQNGIRPVVVVAVRLELVTGHLLGPAVGPGLLPAGPSTARTELQDTARTSRGAP